MIRLIVSSARCNHSNLRFVNGSLIINKHRHFPLTILYEIQAANQSYYTVGAASEEYNVNGKLLSTFASIYFSFLIGINVLERILSPALIDL